MRSFTMGFLFVCALGACGASGAENRTADERWVALATAQRASPIAASAGDLTQDWVSADGRPVKLAVRMPDPARAATVVKLAPGSGDAGPAVRGALARLAARGGGTLRLAPGTYRIGADGIGIGGPSKAAALLLHGLHDVRIEGQGATLLFAQRGTGIRIEQSSRIALVGLTLRYAQPSVVIGRIVATQGGTALALPGNWPGGTLQVHQLTSYDPATRRFPGRGRRAIFGKGGSDLARGTDGRFTGVALDGFAAGEAVSVKLTFYQGAAIQVSDQDAALSEDIVVDHVTIANASGMGVAVERMGRGLAIVDSHIGSTDPATPVGVPFDGIHVTASGGDVLIRGNTVSGTGDDAINLGSPLYRARPGSVAGSVQVSGNVSEVLRGDTLVLFDEALRPLGSARMLDRSATAPDGYSQVRLDGLNATPGAVRYVRDIRYLGSRYAVIGNSIGNCECHGVLAQNPNGLIRGNRFSDLRYNAIRLLTSGFWLEGSGANNVVVEGNRMLGLGKDTRKGFNWAAITVYGEVGDGAGGQPVAAQTPLNSDIVIRGNDIRGAADGCVSVASAVRVRIAANVCRQVSLDPASANLFLGGVQVRGGRAPSPATAAAAARQGIWVDPMSTADVTVALGK